MPGFVSSISNSNEAVFANNADFSGLSDPTELNGLQTNGQLWIGRSVPAPGGTHINVGNITSPLGTLTIGYSAPDITLDLAGGSTGIDSVAVQTGTSPVVPNGAGLITFNGAVVAAGTNPVRTDGTGANTYALEVQISQALAAADATKIGLSNFDSTKFTVSAGGFVSTSGTGILNTLTGNTGTATPTAGNINVVTANSTVKFVGSGSTLTQDFSLDNIILGNSATAITTAVQNTGLGQFVLANLISGNNNTCMGYSAGNALTTGASNTLIGAGAMYQSSGSSSNVAVGLNALASLMASTGFNVALGHQASGAIATGNNNISIGYQAGVNHTLADSSNIDIGNLGTVGQSNTIRIGTQGSGAGQQNTCFIAGIVGVTNSNPQMVSINSSTGQLGIIASTTLTWSVITADQTAAVNNGYIANKGSALLLTLPATAVVGDIIRVTGINTALGWKIVQNANQQIFFGNASTTLGATGFLQSAATRDSVELVCVVAGASTVYNVISSVGNITVS